MQVEVLVIDDSITIQKVIRIALAHLPYHVHLCATLSEAKDLIGRTDFALILADASLSDSKGPLDYSELAKRAGCPLVLLVGSFESVDETGFARVGLKELVRKPFEVGDIVSVCQRHLDGEKRLPPSPEKKTSQPILPKPSFDQDVEESVSRTGPSLPPPPAKPAFTGKEATASFTLSHLNAEIALAKKIKEAPPLPVVEPPVDQKKPRKAYPSDEGVRSSASESPPQKPERGSPQKTTREDAVSRAADRTLGSQEAQELKNALGGVLPEMVREIVEQYCAKHFATLAEQAIKEELRRLADDKTKLLSSDS